jgi:hypothetical protein
LRKVPSEYSGCGFIGGVLRDEAALEGGLENGLLEPCGVGGFRVEYGKGHLALT